MSGSDTPVPTVAPRRRPYHARMVAAFVVHGTVEAVSAATGLSVATVHRWKRIPENWTEVEASRSELVGGALQQLRNGLPIAAERLVRVAKDCDQDAVAVRAAVAVFEAFGRLSERTNLEQRLDALEAALAIHTNHQERSVVPLRPERAHE